MSSIAAKVKVDIVREMVVELGGPKLIYSGSKNCSSVACFWKIALLWNDDVIQGPEIFTQRNKTS